MMSKEEVSQKVGNAIKAIRAACDEAKKSLEDVNPFDANQLKQAVSELRGESKGI